MKRGVRNANPKTRRLTGVRLTFWASNTWKRGATSISVATPAEPRGEKKLYFVQILGGEKLLKLVEKCR